MLKSHINREVIPIPKLSIRNLSKSFGAFKAVNGVSIDVAPGVIHALVGENGAGKSTTMKCIYGIYRPDEGEIMIDGRLLNLKTPRDAMSVGIGMVHQHFMLIPSMEVYKNVVLGDEPRMGPVFDHNLAIRNVRDISSRFGLNVDPMSPVYSLPVGVQQRVEILKLLYRNADILIFDEPTAVLSPAEVESLFVILRAFKEQNKTVIFIAHNLHEVLEISDRISVMRKGTLVATVEKKDATPEKLAELMVGGHLEMPAMKPSSFIKKETALRINDLWVRGERGEWAVRGASLDVRRGEVVGIAGVTGNGQSELEAAIAGLTPVGRGHIFAGEQDITDIPTGQRRNNGFSYIPEDRIKTGLAPLADLVDNALMGFHRKERFSAGPIFRSGNAKIFAKEIMDKYHVNAAGLDVQAGTLSGGNMQRLVLAREMEHGPSLLLISQPTRGVDIGGIAYIHERILSLRDMGKGILLISSDLDEILALSDRVAVMVKGRFAAVLDRKDADREKVGRRMLDGAE